MPTAEEVVQFLVAASFPKKLSGVALRWKEDVLAICSEESSVLQYSKEDLGMPRRLRIPGLEVTLMGGKYLYLDIQNPIAIHGLEEIGTPLPLSDRRMRAFHGMRWSSVKEGRDPVLVASDGSSPYPRWEFTVSSRGIPLGCLRREDAGGDPSMAAIYDLELRIQQPYLRRVVRLEQLGNQWLATSYELEDFEWKKPGIDMRLPLEPDRVQRVLDRRGGEVKEIASIKELPEDLRKHLAYER